MSEEVTLRQGLEAIRRSKLHLIKESIRSLPHVTRVRVVDDDENTGQTLIQVTTDNFEWFEESDNGTCVMTTELNELVDSILALGVEQHEDGIMDTMSDEPILWFRYSYRFGCPFCNNTYGDIDTLEKHMESHFEW